MRGTDTADNQERKKTMSTRLTNETRKTILDRLMRHTFGAREEALRADRVRLGDDVYSDLYSDAVKVAMATLPDGYLQKVDNIKVCFAGRYDHLPLSKMSLFGHEHLYNTAKTYSAKGEMSDRYFDLERYGAKLKEERDTARARGKAALNCATTVKRLVVLWPECLPFVEDLLAESRPTRALTVPVRDLNKTFRLP